MTYHQRVKNGFLKKGMRLSLVRSVRPNARQLALLGMCLLLSLFPGCQTTGSDVTNAGAAPANVTLSPGDTIKITFAAAPELNQTQKIRADGKVGLPLIGEVKAAEKTLPDFQNELIRLYKPQLRSSDLLVTLESGAGRVVVSGAVGRPGKLEFDRPTTVFQAIMEAGGISQYGNLKKVRIVRIVHGEQQSQVMDLTGTLKGRPSQAVYVRDGDVIVVPESAF
jgi:protein involved in polysaccharide export with SLBB domain